MLGISTLLVGAAKNGMGGLICPGITTSANIGIYFQLFAEKEEKKEIQTIGIDNESILMNIFQQGNIEHRIKISLHSRPISLQYSRSCIFFLTLLLAQNEDIDGAQLFVANPSNSNQTNYTSCLSNEVAFIHCSSCLHFILLNIPKQIRLRENE